MNNLQIIPTSKSFLIDFHTNGVFRIEGISQMESPKEFYDPIYIWLSDYYELVKTYKIISQLTIICKIEYIDSSSEKCVFNMLKLIEKFKTLIPVKLDWYCEEDDEKIIGLGNELKHLLKIPIDILYIE